MQYRSETRYGFEVGYPERDRPTGDLVKELVEQGQRLVREEVRLGKLEVREEVKKATRGATYFGAGGALGYLALAVFAFAAVYAIATQLPAWASALIVGAVLAACAGVLFALGKKKVNEVNVAPQETLRTLEEDKEWARGTMQSAKSQRHASA